MATDSVADTAHGSWIRALLRMKPAPIPWDRAGLAAVGIATPVGLALLLAPHDSALVGAGSLASLGAMVVSLMDTVAAGIDRVHRMALAAVLASLGFALGTAVYGHPLLTLVAVIAAALFSGLAGTLGAATSRAALYFLMYAVTAANADFGLASPWLAPLIFFVGAVWRLLLTVVFAGVGGRTFSPERRALAAVYTALADQLRSAGTAASAAAGTALTQALNDAEDTLTAARTPIVARDPRFQSLVGLLDDSADTVDAVIAVSESGRSPDPAATAYLRAVARWLRDPAPSAPAPPPASPVPNAPEAEVLAAALARLDTAVGRVAAIPSRGRRRAHLDPSLPERAGLRQRLRRSRRALVAGGEAWMAVLRLVLCMAIAQGVCLLLDLDRPYLVVLTVAQVMKPDFGSVFARAVQRGTGTVAGVLLGSLAIALVPLGGWQVLLILLLAAALPIAMPRNFALYAAISTPLAVILVEVHAGSHSALVESRMVDTLVGCAIVLLVGYVPWPSTWRAPRRVASDVADLARSVGRYAAIALGGGATDPGAVAQARRDTYRRISDLRVVIDRSRSDPPAISRSAIAWSPVVTALERIVDAITSTAATLAVAGDTVDRRDADQLTAALTELGRAIDGDHAPTATPLPSRGPAKAAARQILLARTAAATAEDRARPRTARRKGRPSPAGG
ncbi:FUSC family protein [Microbacterium caowuchunii]|uniref:Integral membrane bound transporter domain-containing protein n=1 Tax=Microbacterium caowuchunii TaxID=2614638 RepID=A0A5N0TEE1_9MICO|nr:FUSC family protein [Microbacterium caowuchunii]KAA9132998.1 hypothetical protein F6B40_09885 [Microbacterium caowuchunii]